MGVSSDSDCPAASYGPDPDCPVPTPDPDCPVPTPPTPATGKSLSSCRRHGGTRPVTAGVTRLQTAAHLSARAAHEANLV